MAELADGFVALPGGIGTLEELFEVWTWGQLGVHAKPVALLDAAGYWRGLLAWDESPNPLIGVVGEVNDAIGRQQCAAAVFVYARADVEPGRRHVVNLAVRQAPDDHAPPAL